jgi:hypothetical protein
MSELLEPVISVEPKKLIILVEDEVVHWRFYKSMLPRISELHGYHLLTFRNYPELLLQPGWLGSWGGAGFPAEPMGIDQILEEVNAKKLSVPSLADILPVITAWVGPKILDLHIPFLHTNLLPEELLKLSTLEFSQKSAEAEILQGTEPSHTVIITGSDPRDLDMQASKSHEIFLTKNMRADQVLRAVAGFPFSRDF